MIETVASPFLTLLRSGLWKTAVDRLDDFPLSGEQWNFIYKLAKAQTVDGLVYEGVLSLPQELRPSKELLIQWTARIDGIERHNQSMIDMMLMVSNGLKKSDIDVVLLKGFGLGAYYENPHLRISGDVDFYFEDIKSFNAANSLLISRGVRVERGDHHSTFYKFNGYEFENHSNLVDIFNPFVQKYITRLEISERKNYSYLEYPKGKIKVPSYLMMQVQANAHILKHFLGFGIGLRQFCDIARLCNGQAKEFDGEVLRQVFKDLGIQNWMNLVYSFLRDHLGLPKDKIPYAISQQYDSEWLIKEVLYVGNFGFYDQRATTNSPDLEREEGRSAALQRVVPHVLKTLQYAPSEAIWYPIMKVYTKIFKK